MTCEATVVLARLGWAKRAVTAGTGRRWRSAGGSGCWWWGVDGRLVIGLWGGWRPFPPLPGPVGWARVWCSSATRMRISPMCGAWWRSWPSGGSTCRSTRTLPPATGWETVLGQQVESCAVLVVVMSPASAESVWVRREVDLAREATTRSCRSWPPAKCSLTWPVCSMSRCSTAGCPATRLSPACRNRPPLRSVGCRAAGSRAAWSGSSRARRTVSSNATSPTGSTPRWTEAGQRSSRRSCPGWAGWARPSWPRPWPAGCATRHRRRPGVDHRQ